MKCPECGNDLTREDSVSVREIVDFDYYTYFEGGRLVLHTSDDLEADSMLMCIQCVQCFADVSILVV